MPRGSRRGARRAEALEALRRSDDVPRVPARERVEDGPDGRPWVVRSLAGAGTKDPSKAYRCPGCDQEVAARTPHVVAWPEGRADDRRHWHTPCWAARARRAPRG